MTPSVPSMIERRLATFLSGGTWLACAIIAVGLLLAAAGGAPGRYGLPIVDSGIALFILLPVGRVALMLVELLRRRDFALAAVAGLVLAILGLGFALGAHHSIARAVQLPPSTSPQ